MNADSDNGDVQAILQRAGIAVPVEDIPFLQRTLVRQRELLGRVRERVPPETEPAHVFRPAPA